jgi:hypothetical protein
MTKLQFRVLYREFLFRMVDLELLSAHAQGDMSKLFGQFASLFIFLSLLFAGVGLSFAGTARRMQLPVRLIFAWSSEHFLIATTMLVVGLLAVLSWDSTFPDRRDVLVLAPLPVRARTMFLAKVAALATALSGSVLALHILAGLAWPIGLANHGGIVSLVRAFAAYWVTMLSAGAFILCSILAVQGLAAQLPRRHFLRLSAFLQIVAFCLFVSAYFLQPPLVDPISVVKNQRLMAWLPSYWFVGLFQLLNGSMHPALLPLAHRALAGLATSVSGAAGAFLLSYFRTLRKIVEEPDIVPGSCGIWLPRFGGLVETAIVHFSIRTLLRSRLHRVILAFYLGIGFALTISFLKTPVSQMLAARIRGEQWQQVSVPMLGSNLLILGCWVIGMRVVFSMPLDLRANWAFRITPIRGGPQCLAARRQSLFVLSVLPVWAGSAVVFLSLWPWRPAVGHLAVLGLLGAILVECWLGGIQKIPFTCSYLPGKSNFHLMFWISIGGVLAAIAKSADIERLALSNPARLAAVLVTFGAVALLGPCLRSPAHCSKVLVILGVAGVVDRWRTAPEGEETPVEFEEVPSSAIITLGLPRDGGSTGQSAARTSHG